MKHPRYWFKRELPERVTGSEMDYARMRYWCRTHPAKTLLALAKEEHSIRCRRAAIQRMIERAAPLGEIRCEKR